MSTNPYFNKTHRTSEQGLVDDLIIEAIQIHGYDFLYLPRTLQKEDMIYGEDPISKFDDYYDIEMYVKSVDGFVGQGDSMSKFGIEIKDQAILQVSRSRWNAVTADETIRPKEGDLIYYPFNGAILEIKFVANESIHYQLGDLYMYELTVEQFVYSNENFDTGIEELDNIEKNFAYTLLLELGAGAGTYQEDEEVYQGASLATATAKAIVTDFGIPNANNLKIREIVGEFLPANGPIIGDTSSASYALLVIDTQDNINDPNTDAPELEAEADAVLDFTEDDPFSEGNY